MLNNTELAWAAGFFDGEGSTTLNSGRKPIMSLPQKTPECLVRFQKALGLGRVHGPYNFKSSGGRQIYFWRLTKGADVYSALTLLWPYLSEPKKLQASNAGFEVGKSYKPRAKGPKRKLDRETWLKYNHMKAREIAEMFGVAVATVNGYRRRERKKRVSQSKS